MERAKIERPYPPARYAWYVVAVLMLANISAQVDRQILTLLVDPIKRDLAVSDTQIGLLVGLSFALFYTTLGLPVGRLADSWNRRNLIAIGVAVWSLCTALFGLGRTYTQLLLARVGVGMGEATLQPPSLSLLADYFPPKRVATVMSVFGTGVFLGAGLAYFISGLVVAAVSRQGVMTLPLVGDIRPWQSVFLVVGLPGLLLALLLFTVREPERRGAGAASGATVRETFAYLFGRERAAFLSLTLGYSVFVLVNYGTAAWLPAYFGRVHGWGPAEIGVFMGGGTMIFGTLGIVLGGWYADRLRGRGILGSKLLVGTIAAFGALGSGLVLYLTRDDLTAKLMLIPLNIFHAFPFGAAPAAAVELAPARMRGQATAVFFFVMNTVGFTLGPLAVAWFTDSVYGEPADVGYSILTVAAVCLPLAALILGLGSRAYGASVRRLQAEAGPV